MSVVGRRGLRRRPRRARGRTTNNPQRLPQPGVRRPRRQAPTEPGAVPVPGQVGASSAAGPNSMGRAPFTFRSHAARGNTFSCRLTYGRSRRHSRAGLGEGRRARIVLLLECDAPGPGVQHGLCRQCCPARPPASARRHRFADIREAESGAAFRSPTTSRGTPPPLGTPHALGTAHAAATGSRARNLRRQRSSVRRMSCFAMTLPWGTYLRECPRTRANECYCSPGA